MSQSNKVQDTADESHTGTAKNSEFFEWCEEKDNDPDDLGSKEAFEEYQSETDDERGDRFWDGLSPEDREGYESMMTDD